VLNCALTMTASTPLTGNRFYDCHEGLQLQNIFRVDCQKNTFRSSQDVNSLASGTFIPHGNAAITAPTNRFEYMIRYNEFTNINNCVNVPIAAGQYSSSGGVSHGLYASYIGVIQNTFSPGTGTVNFLGNAVNISCVNQFTPVVITN